ncbi:hypothetical protein BB558_003027 [Smittium angustum]|uniref:PIPK domain-containing protein n=1 Tax=Smittium angustum TaxID=133377 RepID=A0A2U1J711_SMIAN|nr:hypothetical protein BB558_003027 [Smittium angustum]
MHHTNSNNLPDSIPKKKPLNISLDFLDEYLIQSEWPFDSQLHYKDKHTSFTHPYKKDNRPTSLVIGQLMRISTQYQLTEPYSIATEGWEKDTIVGGSTPEKTSIHGEADFFDFNSPSSPNQYSLIKPMNLNEALKALQNPHNNNYTFNGDSQDQNLDLSKDSIHIPSKANNPGNSKSPKTQNKKRRIRITEFQKVKHSSYISSDIIRNPSPQNINTTLTHSIILVNRNIPKSQEKDNNQSFFSEIPIIKNNTTTFDNQDTNSLLLEQNKSARRTANTIKTSLSEININSLSNTTTNKDSSSNSKTSLKLFHSTSNIPQLRISNSSETSSQSNLPTQKEPISKSNQLPDSFTPLSEKYHSEYNIEQRMIHVSPIQKTASHIVHPTYEKNEELTVETQENTVHYINNLLRISPIYHSIHQQEEHVDWKAELENAKKARKAVKKNTSISENALTLKRSVSHKSYTVQIEKDINTANETKVASHSSNSTEVGTNNEMYGVKIEMEHVNYVLMYNMLTGIRVSVSRCISKAQRSVEPRDYKASHKFSFDVVGDEQVPKKGCYDFKFKDYAPVIFNNIRQVFGLDVTSYLISLTDRYVLSEVGSSGKSGSFFYYSQDLRFIIKTVSKTEHKFMRTMLKDYYEFVRNNPNTLLSRIYGLHRIKQPQGKKLHFIVMNNIFPPSKLIHEQFDLKGSFQGRRAKISKQSDKNKPKDKKSLVSFKDLDWVELNKKLLIGPAARDEFSRQLANDIGLLMQLKIMDYSLLIGIHDLQLGNSFDCNDISIVRRQTLSLFDPSITPLPVHQMPLSRVKTLRKKVVITDPIALPIAKIVSNNTAVGHQQTSASNVQSSLPIASISNIVTTGNKRFSTQSSKKVSNNTDSILQTTPNKKHNSYQHSTAIRDEQFKRNMDTQPPTTEVGLETDSKKIPEDQPNEKTVEVDDLEGGIRATNNNNEPLDFVYYLGVIDILTPYNRKKKAEHFFKSIWYQDSKTISAVNPKKYASRFLHFIYNQLNYEPDHPIESDAVVNEILERFNAFSSEIKPRKLY